MPFECPICHKEFPLKWNMKQHVRGVHEKYKCPECGKNHSDPRQIQRCLAKTAGEAFECHFCDETFPGYHKRYYHEKSRHPKEYKAAQQAKKSGKQKNAQSAAKKVSNTNRIQNEQISETTNNRQTVHTDTTPSSNNTPNSYSAVVRNASETTNNRSNKKVLKLQSNKKNQRNERKSTMKQFQFQPPSPLYTPNPIRLRNKKKPASQSPQRRISSIVAPKSSRKRDNKEAQNQPIQQKKAASQSPQQRIPSTVAPKSSRKRDNKEPQIHPIHQKAAASQPTKRRIPSMFAPKSSRKRDNKVPQIQSIRQNQSLSKSSKQRTPSMVAPKPSRKRDNKVPQKHPIQQKKERSKPPMQPISSRERDNKEPQIQSIHQNQLLSKSSKQRTSSMIEPKPTRPRINNEPQINAKQQNQQSSKPPKQRTKRKSNIITQRVNRQQQRVKRNSNSNTFESIDLRTIPASNKQSGSLDNCNHSDNKNRNKESEKAPLSSISPEIHPQSGAQNDHCKTKSKSRRIRLVSTKQRAQNKEFINTMNKWRQRKNLRLNHANFQKILTEHCSILRFHAQCKTAVVTKYLGPHELLYVTAIIRAINAVTYLLHIREEKSNFSPLSETFKQVFIELYIWNERRKRPLLESQIYSLVNQRKYSGNERRFKRNEVYDILGNDKKLKNRVDDIATILNKFLISIINDEWSSVYEESSSDDSNIPILSAKRRRKSNPISSSANKCSKSNENTQKFRFDSALYNLTCWSQKKFTSQELKAVLSLSKVQRLQHIYINDLPPVIATATVNKYGKALVRFMNVWMDEQKSTQLQPSADHSVIRSEKVMICSQRNETVAFYKDKPPNSIVYKMIGNTQQVVINKNHNLSEILSNLTSYEKRDVIYRVAMMQLKQDEENNFIPYANVTKNRKTREIRPNSGGKVENQVILPMQSGAGKTLYLRKSKVGQRIEIEGHVICQGSCRVNEKYLKNPAVQRKHQIPWNRISPFFNEKKGDDGKVTMIKLDPFRKCGTGNMKIDASGQQNWFYCFFHPKKGKFLKVKDEEWILCAVPLRDVDRAKKFGFGQQGTKKWQKWQRIQNKLKNLMVNDTF